MRAEETSLGLQIAALFSTELASQAQAALAAGRTVTSAPSLSSPLAQADSDASVRAMAAFALGEVESASAQTRSSLL